MSARDIDEYLAQVDEPKRSTLQVLRQSIQRIIPEAEQGISFGAPAFRIHGKVVAGFAAFKNHLAYLPHSGSVFPELREELGDYVTRSLGAWFCPPAGVCTCKGGRKMADVLLEFPIAAMPDKVYAAITEQNALASWSTPDVSAEPKVGSKSSLAANP